MKKTISNLLLAFCTALITTSCGSFWDGFGTGAMGYGTYNPYATPLGVLPYNLRPDVYAANAAQQAQAQVQENIQAQAASLSSMPVVTSVPVVVPVSTTGTSSSYDGGTSSSSGGRDCGLCLGTGKCKTCNGRGYYYEIGIGSGRHACPNCQSNHNGVCSSCGGTGKR